MKPPGSRGRSGVSTRSVLILVLLGHLVFVAAVVFRADPVRDYPYMGYDSVEWLADGLFLSGQDVHYTVRPPLLPVVQAGLLRIGALGLLPVLVLLFVHLTAFGIFSILRRRVADPIAAGLTLAWLLNSNWMALSLLWLADVPAACLLFWSVYAWWREPGQPAVVRSGVLAGLSALTQPLAALIAAPLAATGILFRRLSRTRVIAAVLCTAGPIAIWLLTRALFLGDVGLIHQNQLNLVRWHTDSIFLYSWSWVAFAGLPLALTTIVGGLLAARHAARDAGRFFLVAVAIVVVGFWVLAFASAASRFLAYGYVLAPLLMVELWERWPVRVQRAATAVLLVWSVLLPAVSFTTPGTITVWPVPPVELTARVEGTALTGPMYVPGSIESVTQPVSAVAGRNFYRRILDDAARPPRDRGLEPSQVADAVSGLFLIDTGTPRPRHQAGWLGNLLRRRVTAVPLARLRDVWPAMTVARIGEVDGKSVFRAEIAGLDGHRLLIADPGSRAEAFLETPRDGLVPDPEVVASAERIAATIGPRWTALVTPARPLHAYIALLARGPVDVREAGDPIVMEALESPPASRIDDVALYTRRILGNPVVFVAPD